MIQRSVFKLALRLLLLVPLTAFVAWVNYRVDPANLYSGRERDIARILLTGRNAAHVSNFDERELQRLMLESRSKGLDVLCLGSSRTMQFRQSFFSGLTFHNASVSGGSLEDYIALWEVARRNGADPSTVILGIEPWIFNPNRNETRWRTLAPFYFAGLRRIGVEVEEAENAHAEEQWSRLSELLSPRYFQASLATLAAPRAELRATKVFEDARMVLPDGSFWYESDYRLPTEDTVKERARKYAGTSMHSMDNYLSLDAADQRHFESFMKALSAEGRSVRIVLSPYHPVVLKRILSTASANQLIEAERYIRHVAASADAEVIGSFHPSASGVSERDFIDGIHLKDEAVSRLWAQGMVGAPSGGFETALRREIALSRFTAVLLDESGLWKLEWEFAGHTPVREIRVTRSDGKLIYQGSGTSVRDRLPVRSRVYKYEATVVWNDETTSNPVSLSVEHHGKQLGGVFLRAEVDKDGRWRLTAIPNGGHHPQYIFYRFDQEKRTWVNLTPWSTSKTWRGALPSGRATLLVKAREPGGGEFASPQLIVQNESSKSSTAD